MRKNNSKLNFTKNHQASLFSQGRLKISKCSISQRFERGIGRRGDILPQFLLKNKTREWTDDVTRLIGGRMSLGKGETYSQIRTL